MRYILPLLALALLLLNSGCVTMQCSQLSGEHNSVKSDQDQTPSTKVDAKIPLLR